jgi:hypothetical protein
MDLDVAVFPDGKVAFTPAGNLVQLGGVGDRPALAYFGRGARSGDGCSHGLT